MFYVDSTNGYDPFDFLPVIQAFPDVLFFPEQKTLLHYAYTAPYLEYRGGNLGTPSSVLQYYPDAFSLLYMPSYNGYTIDSIYEVLDGVQLDGELLLYQTWWESPDNLLTRAILNNVTQAGPVCNITSPPSGSIFSMTNSIVIVVEAYDWYRPIVKVEIAMESSPNQIIATLSGNLRNVSNWWIYSWEWQNHTARTYQIVAAAYNDNNVKVSSSTISVTITSDTSTATGSSNSGTGGPNTSQSSATEEESMQGAAISLRKYFYLTVLAIVCAVLQ